MGGEEESDRIERYKDESAEPPAAAVGAPVAIAEGQPGSAGKELQGDLRDPVVSRPGDKRPADPPAGFGAPQPPLQGAPSNQTNPARVQSQIISLDFEPAIADCTFFPNDGYAYATNDQVIFDYDWQKEHSQYTGKMMDSSFTPEKKCIQGTSLVNLKRCRHGERRDPVQDQKDKEEQSKSLSKMLSYKYVRLDTVLKDDHIRKHYEIGDGGLVLFKDKLYPVDVSQGEIGTCYFLSALAAVAENSKRLERCLLQKQISPSGCYCIALNITGCWKHYFLDDCFPRRDDGIFPFTSPDKGVFWPMLFEKAYAKAFGAYWHIGNGGQGSNAMRDLTGAPAEILNFGEDADPKKKPSDTEILSKLKEAYEKKFIMGCGSVSDKRGEGRMVDGKLDKTNEFGIVFGHGYTLSKVVTLSNGTTLLRLRNPWGKGEWTGDWGVGSRLWTDRFRAEADYHGEEPGCFFIDFDNFKKYYENIYICHYIDSYVYSYLPILRDDKRFFCSQFFVREDGDYYLGASQPDENMFMGDDNYNYGYLSFTVLKKEADHMRFVQSFTGQERDVWKMLRLTRGAYAMFVYNNWNSPHHEKERQLTYWTYGPTNVVIKLCDINQQRSARIVQHALLRHAQSQRDKWKRLEEPKYHDLIYINESDVPGYYYAIYENNMTNYEPTVTFRVPSYENYECIYPVNHRIENQITGPILKGNTMMVVLRQTSGNMKLQTGNSFEFAFIGA